MILVMENHCLDNMNRNKTLLLSELAANKYSILVLSVVQKGDFSRSPIPKKYRIKNLKSHISGYKLEEKVGKIC